jgi:hypothetical protein
VSDFKTMETTTKRRLSNRVGALSVNRLHPLATRIEAANSNVGLRRSERLHNSS